MLFAPFFFRPVCHLLTGLSLCTLPPICSTSCPQKRLAPPHRTWLCLAPHLPMIIYGSSVALAIRIFPLLRHTNLLPAPPCASFLAILLIIRDTVVLISRPTESSSLDMWCLTRLPFPSLSSNRLQLMRILIFCWSLLMWCQRLLAWYLLCCL